MPRSPATPVLATLALVALAACSGRGTGQGSAASPPPARTAAAAAPGPHAPDIPTPPPLAVPPLPASATPEAPDDPQAVAVNEAAAPAASKAARGVDPALVRAEVLLDRAHFSPGVIDGRPGDNLKNAVTAYEAAHGLPQDGRLDADLWKALTDADAGPTIVRYTIADADVAGPFAPDIPKDYDQMAKLDSLAYTSPLEGLAEKFHMDEALLKALNPGADFSKAGAVILVAAVAADDLPASVTAIDVDKAARQVRAFGADGSLVATYPATVGSTERPAPSGVFKIKGVAHDPPYTYDPSRLTFGPKSKGKLTIKPGPNNPVGAVWIDLSVPTYGIHGAPDPKLVGKVSSHGCVRLTNWDARQLASAVKPGVKVTFVGEERPAKG